MYINNTQETIKLYMKIIRLIQTLSSNVMSKMCMCCVAEISTIFTYFPCVYKSVISVLKCFFITAEFTRVVDTSM